MLLCDSAQVSGGKLFVLGGGWSHIYTPDSPVNMALAILIAVPWDRANQRHTVRASLKDEDGNLVEAEDGSVELEGQLEVGRPPGLKPGTDLNFPLSLTYNGLSLRAGGYRWELEIDGEPKARVPFRVEAPAA